MASDSELESTSGIERDGIPDLWRNRELPQRWREQASFSLRIAWLSTTPRLGTLEVIQENAEFLRRQGRDERADEILQGITGHPGWWLHSHVYRGDLDSLEAAIKKACKTILHSDFSAGGFLELPAPAPVKPVKAQRKTLVTQLETGMVTNAEVTREAFLEIAPGYALSVWIEDASHSPDIDAEFQDEDNPLRSLETVWCIVSFTPLDGDEQLLAAGYVRFEGEVLHVGDWSHSFSPDSIVEGAAFSEVHVNDDAEDGWYILLPFTRPVTLEQFRTMLE